MTPSGGLETAEHGIIYKKSMMKRLPILQTMSQTTLCLQLLSNRSPPVDRRLGVDVDDRRGKKPPQHRQTPLQTNYILRIRTHFSTHSPAYHQLVAHSPCGEGPIQHSSMLFFQKHSRHSSKAFWQRSLDWLKLMCSFRWRLELYQTQSCRLLRLGLLC